MSAIKLMSERAYLLGRLADHAAGISWESLSWEERVAASHLRLFGLAQVVLRDDACQEAEHLLQITEAGRALIGSVGHKRAEEAANVGNQRPHRRAWQYPSG